MACGGFRRTVSRIIVGEIATAIVGQPCAAAFGGCYGPRFCGIERATPISPARCRSRVVADHAQYKGPRVHSLCDRGSRYRSLGAGRAPHADRPKSKGLWRFRLEGLTLFLRGIEQFRGLKARGCLRSHFEDLTTRSGGRHQP